MRHFVLLLLIGSTLSAQDLATRIASVGTGTVRMQFAADSGVCGTGEGGISVRTTSSRTTTQDGNGRRRAEEWENRCEEGPVRVSLDVTDRHVTAIRSYVGGRWRGDADLDLGEVPVGAATAFLMDLAATAPSRVARDAVFPAIVAQGPAPEARMLSIAKDEERPREVRTNTMFWLSQSAGARATEGLQELIEDPDRRVREQAVFSLSQRPNDESVPALIRLARTHRDPQIRRTAVFWLGQKQDPRALAYFEEVLAPR